MSTDPRWTEATEALVARVISVGTYDATSQDTRDAFHIGARTILTTLADAGLLVQPGSDVKEEFAYPVGPPEATRWIATWLRDPVIPGISKHLVITTPWVELATEAHL